LSTCLKVCSNNEIGFLMCVKCVKSVFSLDWLGWETENLKCIISLHFKIWADISCNFKGQLNWKQVRLWSCALHAIVKGLNDCIVLYYFVIHYYGKTNHALSQLLPKGQALLNNCGINYIPGYNLLTLRMLSALKNEKSVNLFQKSFFAVYFSRFPFPF